ncbi:MAG TPA: VTT domain-containing protein, partial [Pseudobdellovibrionaceae bacterium]|nr:VTT domain-containing protein [Pseudobdellovibrionaceae bacterium]
IVFAETGLVVTPFLPGDSLLFATGALAAIDSSGLHAPTLVLLLMLATFLGDNTNYYIGQYFGDHAFKNDNSVFFKRKNLEHTKSFYKKYGPLTVIIARFIPIVRTMAPFVAGLGEMKYKKFISYSVFGSILWINSFLWAGYYFGNVPSVKKNFHYVIVAVIFLSVLPIFIGILQKLMSPKKVADVP